MGTAKYVKEFYELTCHNDILDISKPVQNLNKEISESMAIIKQLRKLTLKNKQDRFEIYDFCAGNALTSVIASFLFKNVHCFAVDKRPRDRNWEKVRNFTYLNSDIITDDWIHFINQDRKEHPLTKTVILSVHPCTNLAERVISIHNGSQNDYLILMPCCTGNMTGYGLPEVIVNKIGKYLKWCMFLQTKIERNSKLNIDENCLSPKNAILTSGI